MSLITLIKLFLVHHHMMVNTFFNPIIVKNIGKNC